MADVKQLVGEAAAARERVMSRVRDLSVDQATFRPAPGEWSIAEVVEHLVRAEQSGIALIWRAADGVRRGRPVWSGEHVHRGLSIETIVERTWGPKAEAPDNARPHLNAALDYWANLLAGFQPILERLVAVLDGLDLEAVIAPHVISGPLDARQRLEFLRFHMELHRRQIEDVMRASGYPRS